MAGSPGEFAQQLRSLRQAQGLSLRALASLIGVSSVTVWKWENGDSKPRARLITPLAQALAVPPVKLQSSVKESAKLPKTAAEKISKQPDAVAPDQSDSPVPLPEHPGDVPEVASLPDVISRAKQMIAEASGTGPNSIKILIEY